MKALKTVNATESTALAIAKAAENANASYLATLETHLRISNQESSARKQEQKSNEIINHLKRNLLQKKLTRKPCKGFHGLSRETESFSHKKHKKQNQASACRCYRGRRRQTKHRGAHSSLKPEKNKTHKWSTRRAHTSSPTKSIIYSMERKRGSETLPSKPASYQSD
jgi:hypothetical protein